MSYTFTSGEYRAYVKSSLEKTGSNSGIYSYSNIIPFEVEDKYKNAFYHKQLIFNNTLLFPHWSSQWKSYDTPGINIGYSFRLPALGYGLALEDVKLISDDTSKLSYDRETNLFTADDYGIVNAGYRFEIASTVFSVYVADFTQKIVIIPNSGIKINYPYYKIYEQDCVGGYSFYDYEHLSDEVEFVFSENIRTKMMHGEISELRVTSSDDRVSCRAYVPNPDNCNDGWISLSRSGYKNTKLSSIITISVVDTNNQIISTDSCNVLFDDEIVLDFRPDRY